MNPILSATVISLNPLLFSIGVTTAATVSIIKNYGARAVAKANGDNETLAEGEGTMLIRH
jgi:hypothetical protein